MNHHYVVCEPGCGDGYGCIICLGGLSLCEICGQGEGDLEPECPGYRPCNCQIGTCESKPNRTCRMGAEIGTDSQ